MLCFVTQPWGLFETPRTEASQAPLSMGILQARILDWVAMPSSGDLPNPGIEPKSPALQPDSLQSEPPGKQQCLLNIKRRCWTSHREAEHSPVRETVLSPLLQMR